MARPSRMRLSPLQKPPSWNTSSRSAAAPSERAAAHSTLPTTRKDRHMHVSKDDIPVKINATGAIARTITDFGIASGAIRAVYITINTRTDLSPLLKGLKGDACQAAHVGYLTIGDIVVTYSESTTERCTTRNVFHWPPGHS